jgi:hypothetical protein
MNTPPTTPASLEDSRPSTLTTICESAWFLPGLATIQDYCQTLLAQCIQGSVAYGGLYQPLLELIESQPWMQFRGQVHQRVQARVSVIAYTASTDQQLQHTFRCVVKFPDGRAMVDWSPWPTHCPKPPWTLEATAYSSTKPCGSWIQEPRRTALYGLDYRYSGTTKEAQAEIPNELKVLCDHAMDIGQYKAKDRPNSILESYYRHGSHSIGEHSDNEQQFSAMKDVIAYVRDGCRELVWRVCTHTKKGRKVVPAPLTHLCEDPERPESTRRICGLVIPEGVYRMTGTPHFQEMYTHQILIQSGTLARLIREQLQGGMSRFPRFPQTVPLIANQVSQTNTVQWDWICTHADQIQEAIAEGVFAKPNATPKSIARAMKNFQSWKQERTSYTLRCFVSPPESVSTQNHPANSRKRKRKH